MEKLSKYLHNINFEDEYNHDCQVIISDSNEPGEGEHKILQYLKQNYSDDNGENQYLIYGLDADLIMLSMASKSTIFIYYANQFILVKFRKIVYYC